MTTLTAGFTPLPPSILQLLERYTRARDGVEARLWVRHNGDWSCLWPEAGTFDGGPRAETRDIEDGDRSLRLEVCGSGGTGDLDFLAASIRQIVSYEQEARSAAHELSERYEEINLLYSISEILASFLSMEEATTRILDEVADVLGARRAALWVADAATNTLVLTAAVGDDGMQGPIRIDDENSVTARVFREQTRHLASVQEIAPFREHEVLVDGPEPDPERPRRADLASLLGAHPPILRSMAVRVTTGRTESPPAAYPGPLCRFRLPATVVWTGPTRARIVHELRDETSENRFVAVLCVRGPRRRP